MAQENSRENINIMIKITVVPCNAISESVSKSHDLDAIGSPIILGLVIFKSISLWF
jgi:hypothetical protein